MKARRIFISRIKVFVVLTAMLACVAAAHFNSRKDGRTLASATGPAPTFTGAPGESNCTACHTTFDVNSGTGNVTIVGVPKNYLPGQQIPLTVTVSQSDGVLYGYQLTAVGPTGGKVGSYSFAPTSPPIIQLVTGFVNGVEREYIEHTINGITPTQFGSKSWTFEWTAPSSRVGKVSFYAAGNAADSDGGSNGDRIYTTSAASLSGTAIANFNGDSATEFGVFRPSDGIWYSINTAGTESQIVQWGLAGDIPSPGDYDGDGITDRAVYRPAEGVWYLLRSSAGVEIFRFGLAGDVPVSGDYDGDLKSDAAVFRPSEGVWYVANSTGGHSFVKWGLPTDIPVPGDYDGDAKTDIAVFRASEGIWYILKSTGGITYTQFGLPADNPAQGDYDGDGRHDVAIFRQNGGQWWILGSSVGVISTQFGSAGDVSSPGDYDGDGKTDIAVFRPATGEWYSIRSGDQGITFLRWGANGDRSIPNAYTPQ